MVIALVALLVIIAASYFVFDLNISADTNTEDTIEKNINIALNNYNTSPGAATKYNQIISKITPNKPGYRCQEKVVRVELPASQTSLSDSEIISSYRKPIYNSFASANPPTGDNVYFMGSSLHSRYVDKCYKLISDNPSISSQEAIANADCDRAINAVIMESLKQNCEGLR